MGKGRIGRIMPSYVQSVGRMRDEQVRVAAVCEKCRQWFKVDLEAIICLRGEDYSLVDQRGPCRVLDCDGLAFFLWSPGNSTPYCPLTTERGDQCRMNKGC